MKPYERPQQIIKPYESQQIMKSFERRQAIKQMKPMKSMKPMQLANRIEFKIYFK